MREVVLRHIQEYTAQPVMEEHQRKWNSFMSIWNEWYSDDRNTSYFQTVPETAITVDRNIAEENSQYCELAMKLNSGILELSDMNFRIAAGGLVVANEGARVAMVALSIMVVLLFLALCLLALSFRKTTFEKARDTLMRRIVRERDLTSQSGGHAADGIARVATAFDDLVDALCKSFLSIRTRMEGIERGTELLTQSTRHIMADQANLFALSAAIEVARVQEQGSGFSVVSNELHHLAEYTTRLSKDVDILADKLRGQARGAMDELCRLIEQAGAAQASILRTDVPQSPHNGVSDKGTS